MFKKKCPSCGVKNDKERTVCIECGTPLALEQVEEQLARVSTEGETQARAGRERAEARSRDDEKVLHKAMGPRVHKRSAWFWVGVVLLSISALWWLVLILASLEDIGGAVLAAVLTTSIPIGVGVYCVRRGRKAPAVQMQQSPKTAYVSQPAVTPTQETQRATEPTYLARPVAKLAQRTGLGFLGTLKEKLRNKTRDRLCAGLCALGIDARLAERGRVEEKFGGKGSLGLIEIPEGSIRWVNVRKETHGSGQSSTTYYYTEYGVPDPRLEPNFSKLRIKSVRKKNFPILGQVVDLRWELLWEGEDFGPAVIDRLNSDDQLKQPIMESRDVTITAISDYSCWIMSTQTRDVPSGELWNCYQVIAQQLLADWPSG